MPYDKAYFQKYALPASIGGRPLGDRSQYTYWHHYLRRRLPNESPLLEVGCGLGYFGARVAQSFDYTGTDYSEIAVAQARQCQPNLTFLQMDAQVEWPFPPAHFGAIVAFDVVEHLATPERFFEEAYQATAPGGLLLLTTPNVNSLGNVLKANKPGLVPSMLLDDTHVSLLSTDQWERLVTQVGFHVVASGTDFLWDLPYSRRIPLTLQKLLLLPLNRMANRWAPLLPWKYGENLVIVARRPAHNAI